MEAGGGLSRETGVSSWEHCFGWETESVQKSVQDHYLTTKNALFEKPEIV